jgi:general secretion pathway protein G
MIDMMTRPRRQDGFTLIELMIVMVVLGILAGIVLFAVGPFQTSANTSKTKANAVICSTASAAQVADNANGGTKTSNDFASGAC